MNARRGFFERSRTTPCRLKTRYRRVISLLKSRLVVIRKNRKNRKKIGVSLLKPQPPPAPPHPGPAVEKFHIRDLFPRDSAAAAGAVRGRTYYYGDEKFAKSRPQSRFVLSPGYYTRRRDAFKILANLSAAIRLRLIRIIQYR